jgi:hypothetical protein
MRAFEQFGLAAVAVVAGSCGDAGRADDSANEGDTKPLDEIIACAQPCARLIISPSDDWSGPPLPMSRRSTLGAISCMRSDEPRAEYPTRFDIDREAQTVDFECDGEAGLHLVGHFSGITNFGESRAEGKFGPDTRLVLSATGEMAEWLGEVMDPSGTDLWRAYRQPPQWFSWELGGVAITSGTVSIPDLAGAEEVANFVQFGFELYIPPVAPPP